MSRHGFLLIILSTFVFGALAAVTSLSTSLSGLMFCHFLTGLGLGGAMPNIVAIASEYAPRSRRATLVTMMFCGFPLGAVLAGGGSAHLIATYGWHTVFYVGRMLPLALLPLLWFGLPESLCVSIRVAATRRLPMASQRGASEGISDQGTVP